MTPAQRSIKKLKGEGYRVAVVEKWNTHARIRQDLFGIFDLLAIRETETVGVQVTSSSNVAARVRKITDAVALNDIRAANWTILVHGWRKNSKGKWVCREVDLS